jgi:hypothetical protein
MLKSTSVMTKGNMVLITQRAKFEGINYVALVINRITIKIIEGMNALRIRIGESLGLNL